MGFRLDAEIQCYAGDVCVPFWRRKNTEKVAEVQMQWITGPG
jgi:hypothetical protein